MTRGKDYLTGSLFGDEPEPENDPIWGDRWIRKDRQDANIKPYGRPEPEPQSFNIDDALKARDEGMARAEQNADERFCELFYETIVDCARRLPKFNADDIWENLPEQPKAVTQSARVAGSIVKRAVENRIIRFTSEFQQSRRRSLHAHPIRFYQSLTYGSKPEPPRQENERHVSA